MPNKEKLFTYGFNYFDVDEKSVKKASVYAPYEDFESSGFTFKHATNNDTYNVKLNEKMNLIGQTYKWDKTYNTMAMDQKRFVYTDKNTQQDFYKTMSSGNSILNKL